MPSKIQNIQCFSFPKCHKQTCEFSCYTCPFAIPNIYAISSIANDISKRVERFSTTEINGVKKKEKKMLLKTLDLLSQALDEFGEEFVWSFIDGGEKTFENQLKIIDKG